MNTNDIAWAAGVFEGEGTCGSRKYRSNNYRLVAAVDQKDRWLCDTFQRLFGGRVIAFENAGIRHEGTYHRWYMYNSEAAGFLMTIFVFLSPRRQEQVEKALKLWRFDGYKVEA